MLKRSLEQWSFRRQLMGFSRKIVHHAHLSRIKMRKQILDSCNYSSITSALGPTVLGGMSAMYFRRLPWEDGSR